MPRRSAAWSSTTRMRAQVSRSEPRRAKTIALTASPRAAAGGCGTRCRARDDLQRERSAVRVHDLLHVREPDPRAARARGEERIEDPVADLLGNPGPVSPTAIRSSRDAARLGRRSRDRRARRARARAPAPTSIASASARLACALAPPPSPRTRSRSGSRARRRAAGDPPRARGSGDGVVAIDARRAAARARARARGPPRPARTKSTGSRRSATGRR